jgi:hypothetical protein
MLITAYFLPELKRTKGVVRDLKRFIKGWNLPMVLMADFNSTETDEDRGIFPTRAENHPDPSEKILFKSMPPDKKTSEAKEL